MTATLSKALGSQGGAVLGPAAVRDHLVDTARPFIFDTGLAPASVGAALAALRVLIAEPRRAQAVLRHAAALAEVCGVAEPPDRPWCRWCWARRRWRLAAATACLERGVRVGCFRPPTVPAGTSRLRLTARASLSDDEMALARAVLTEVLSAWRHELLVVTGTDTGVGKTVATAALACHARLAGSMSRCASPSRPAAPTATTTSPRSARLSGVTELHGSWRYPEPLAPAAAARAGGHGAADARRAGGVGARRSTGRDG